MVKKKAIHSTPVQHSREHSAGYRCPHCHGPVSQAATFCVHCGYRLAGGVPVAKIHCPHCRQMIEASSVFCKYCGTHAVQTPQRFFASFGYVIVFAALLLLVYIVLWSTTDFFQQPSKAVPVDNSETLPRAPVVTLTDVQCDGRTPQAALCGTATWDAAHGNLLTITTGETALATITSPGSFCGTPAARNGQIVATLTQDGTLVDTVSGTYTCDTSFSDKRLAPAGKEPQFVTKTVQFRAEPTYGRGRGQGTVAVALGAYPNSCTLQGTFVTDNDPEIHGTRRYCHGATGTYAGSFDAYTQSVMTDPGLFFWSGLSKGQDNPPSETYDGYALYMYTCDSLYYTNPRYPVSVVVSTFDRDLIFTWDYFNDDTMPAVDFTFELTCEVR